MISKGLKYKVSKEKIKSKLSKVKVPSEVKFKPRSYKGLRTGKTK